jgi:arylsulfatase A-like enzyme
MNRTVHRLWQGATFLTIAFFSSTLTAAAPPNILFIFSDDHSLQTIGAYETWLAPFCREHKVTPNIDRLASQGALFTRSYCGNSICSPSRATVLSGVHTHVSGVTHLGGRIREGVWTFPPAIQAAGYQTALIGKWHMGQNPQGFDAYSILPGQGSYWNPAFIKQDGTNEVETGYATDVITRKALDWLKRRDPSKPFLLMCHHKAPHRNFQPPVRYFRYLEDVTIPEPETLFDDYSGRGQAAREQKMEIGRDMSLSGDLKVLPAGQHPKFLTGADADEWEATYGRRNDAFRNAGLEGRELTRWKYQQYMKDFMRCVKAVDDGVGELLAYLDANGLADNTVVVYSSDQGFFNGEHGWFDKRWIYEESLHMPLVIRWPGVVKPGMKISRLVQNIDYAPTFAEIAGVKAPTTLHGRSLMPLLRGENPADWRKSIYYHYYDPGHAVNPHYGLRTDDHTLAFFPKHQEWELYDLDQDPQQLRNIAGEPTNAALLAALKDELARLRKDFGDTDDVGAPQPKRQGAKKQDSK